MAAEIADPNPSPLLQVLANINFVAVSGPNFSFNWWWLVTKLRWLMVSTTSEVFPTLMILWFYFSMHMGSSWVLATSSLQDLE